MPIEIKALKFKYNLSAGSQDSINLLLALNKTKQTSVFKSESIQVLIGYKWTQISYIAYRQTLITALYILTLTIHINYMDNIFTKILLVLFCIYFIVFEVIGIVAGNIAVYISDIWNLIDVIYIVLFVVWIFIESQTDRH